MAKTIEEKPEKQHSKIQWVLFVILIPLLFAVTLALVVMSVIGINVFETAKEYGQKIPVVNKWVQEDQTHSIEQFEEDVVKLEAQVKEKEAEIAQLESLISDQDKEMETLVLEKQRLEDELATMMEDQATTERDFQDIVKTYETMSPKTVAPILSQMSDDKAVKILSNLKSETLASIMEKMTAEEAARFTELLTSEE